MPIFITQGRYSQSAIKGMVAKPEDRAEAVAELAGKAGGKLLHYWVTLGEYDFLVVFDMPSHKEVSAAMLAAGAGGGITDFRTTLAMTSAEAKAVFGAAGDLTASFRPAGAG
ncbi:GYD domain-containing protein [Marinimicrococcus flavescens]|uniref:GYD domain-containing protein n=1 Tax=Marinimicrococcus flavescens TaxID=3031815 RepID=A0AAP3XRT1_9PROT|nr:GYD domain-containing protein [Marinimicrococcus flavescens]